MNDKASFKSFFSLECFTNFLGRASLLFLFALMGVVLNSTQVALAAGSYQAKSSGTSSSVDHTIGLGAVLGSPTALSGKYFLNSKTAIDATLSFFSSDYTLVGADYLIHYPGAITVKGLESLVGYIGIGGLVVFTNKSRSTTDGYLGTSQGAMGVGARVPLGVLYNMRTTPIEFFGEIAPGISLAPATAVFIHIGIGARYYF